MSNETKIGLMAVIIIGLFIAGYKFLEGKNVLTSSQLFYVEYQDVEMLTSSAPVLINGFQVGVVSNLYLKPEDMQTIVAVLNIDRGVAVPKTAIAEITSTGLMGGKAIRLSFDRPCEGAACAQSGDYLQGGTVGMVEQMLGSDLGVYMDQLSTGVGKSFDVLNRKINDEDPNNKIGRSLRDLQSSIATLKATSENLNALIANSSGKLTGLLGNLESLTGSFNESEEQIKTIFANTADLTGKLKEIDMSATLDTATLTMSEARQALEELSATLETATKTLDQVNGLTTGISNGEGTLGLLFKDETLYHKLNETSLKLDSLLTDIKAKPYRYIPLKNRRKIKRYDRKDQAGN
ncbi:MAG: MlaD family protein [Bacteroidota bacterium]